MHNAFRHFPVLILHQVNISILYQVITTGNPDWLYILIFTNDQNFMKQLW